MDTGGDASPCTAGELPELIAQLDAEFVSGRSRSTSLSLRYPSLLGPGNLHNIFVWRERGRVAASIAVKTFRWIAAERSYAGAMVGMVWTDPARRGSGLASRLLAQVGSGLRTRADFAVLWTARPGFYARAGWVAADRASLGTIEGRYSRGTPGMPVDFARVRAIWQRRLPRAERDAGWQPPLPLPAESLELFVAADAYAIAGRRGDDLYCYETPGDPAALSALLEQMRAGCRTVLINEQTGSPAWHRLTELGVTWERKPLAMWLPLRETGILSAADGWYVPWLDRI